MTVDSCKTSDSVLVRLEARPRPSLVELRALTAETRAAVERDGYYCVDGEFHAETRRILAHYVLEERDNSGSIIPSDAPLVRI